MTPNKLFVTVLGSGLSPKAPGTAGSLAALVLGVLFLQLLPLETFLLATVAVSVIGVLEINKYQAATGGHDPKEVVVDELAGMWLAMAMVPQDLLSWGLAFLFFRVYDIWKPSVIGRIDRKAPGGLGVMGDDLAAGFFAGLTVLALFKGLELLG